VIYKVRVVYEFNIMAKNEKQAKEMALDIIYNPYQVPQPRTIEVIEHEDTTYR